MNQSELIKRIRRIKNQKNRKLSIMTIGFFDFKMEDGDYIISPNSSEAIKYKILYKGKDVTNSCRAIIRNRMMENEQRTIGKNKKRKSE